MTQVEAKGDHPPPFSIEFLLRPCMAISNEYRRCFFAATRISNSLKSFYQWEQTSLVGQRRVLGEVLAGSGHGFGGLDIRRGTTVGRLLGHQSLIVDNATRRFDLRCTDR